MADEKTPAAGGGKFWDSISESVAKSIAPMIEQKINGSLQPVVDQVKSLQDGLANAPTADAVSKAVTEAIAAQSATQEKAGARQKFIAEKLKGIPDAYHSHIGDDPAKWDEQEQNLRKVLRGDLEKLGVKADNLGGTPGTPGTTGDGTPGSGGNPRPVTAAVDTSKLSGIELLRMGVQQTSGSASQPGDTPAPGTPAEAAPVTN